MRYTQYYLSLSFILVLALAGCSSKLERAQSYEDNEQWLKAVIEYRKLHRENPADVEVKTRLEQTELAAAEYFYRQGYILLLEQEYDEAIAQFQQALIAYPGHEKSTQAMQEVTRKKESYALLESAQGYYQSGANEQARIYASRALEFYPQQKEAEKLLQKIEEIQQEEKERNFILSSSAPITLRFKETKLKTAFEFIVNAYDVNVIFDDEVKNKEVTLFAKNVSFEQALSLLQRTTKTFYKIVGDRTLLIAPDTDEKRDQYEDYILRTFTLKSIEAKVMADIIKSALSVNNVIINADMNALIVRETEERIKLIEEMVAINDRKPAEMILEVELMEVNRSKTELLGFDFGSQISVSYQPFTGSFEDTLSAGVITLPNIVLNYFKSDVDAKTLANPRIRVVDNKQAKIHIGDRVPLRSSTIQDATGQTRTTYEYRDIGIRLQVEPDIYLDNSVSVQLGLEVSTLGQNLGTVDEPAYSIGTRNADTTMILKDGETAILGGLIRDEDRKNRVKVPGLGDIPLVGALFTQFDDQVIRTDVLLTITPRIVRTWDMADKPMRGIYSGTKKRYATTPVFGTLTDDRLKTDAEVTERSDESDDLPYRNPQINIDFSKPVYIEDSDSSFDVVMHVDGAGSIGQLGMELQFDPSAMSYAGYELNNGISGELNIESDSDQGVLYISGTDLSLFQDTADTALFALRFESKRKGNSYLLSKATNYIDENGEERTIESNVSRIIIR